MKADKLDLFFLESRFQKFGSSIQEWDFLELGKATAPASKNMAEHLKELRRYLNHVFIQEYYNKSCSADKELL